jgi:hypothetical protein
MPDIQLAVEGWLASLDETEFRALVMRTRPPDEPEIVGGPDDRSPAQH